MNSKKNLCHKVIGKRGERVLRVLELREDEVINQEGIVVLRGQGRDSTGQSRDQGRGKKGAPVAAQGHLHQPGGQGEGLAAGEGGNREY